MRLLSKEHPCSTLLRFSIAGSLNTCISYTIFVTIYSLLDTINASNAIALAVSGSLFFSLFCSYYLQQRFVWSKRLQHQSQYTSVCSYDESRHAKTISSRHRLIYGTYYLSNASFNIASVRLMREMLSLDPRLGQALFTLVSSLCSFFFLRWLFKDIKR